MSDLSFVRVRIGSRISCKRLAAAWVTLLALLAAAPKASADPIVSSESLAFVNVGDVFSVDFRISDVTDLFSYQFSVGYDPLLLSAGLVTEGSFLSSAGTTFFIADPLDDLAGLITFNANTLIGAIAGASGSGSLLSVQFTALAVGTSVVSAVFDAANGDGLYDSTGAAIDPIKVTAGSKIGVLESAPAPIPEPGTLLLLGSGLAVAALRRRRSRKASSSSNPVTLG